MHVSIIPLRWAGEPQKGDQEPFLREPFLNRLFGLFGVPYGRHIAVHRMWGRKKEVQKEKRNFLKKKKRGKREFAGIRINAVQLLELPLSIPLAIGA